jgi:hypothetical protein
MSLPLIRGRAPTVYAFLVVLALPAAAQQTVDRPTDVAPRATKNTAARQAELEAALVKMLSGATLEGSFTSTGVGSDPSRLSREKYTLGDVKKLQGNLWLIPARIEYGEHDVTLPLTLPIRWAGDTPLIVVDNVGLPGFGTVSARVMFFDGRYAGYWKHGEQGGHLFGVIRPSDDEAAAPRSRGNSPTHQQEDKQPRQ